jgi:hypothetical protein
MGVWDQSSEAGASQPNITRWHVRLHTADNTIIFADLQASGIDDAVTQAEAANPGAVAEWAVLERDFYGIWSNGMAASMYNPRP